MIRFLDGPAAGETLDLRRAPVLLRVVHGPRGKLDALDQVHDRPEPRETITVYRREGTVGWMFLRPGGRYAMASYRLFAEQPDDATARDTEKWRAWCLSIQEREKAVAPAAPTEGA